MTTSRPSACLIFFCLLRSGCAAVLRGGYGENAGRSRPAGALWDGARPLQHILYRGEGIDRLTGQSTPREVPPAIRKEPSNRERADERRLQTPGDRGKRGDRVRPGGDGGPPRAGAAAGPLEELGGAGSRDGGEGAGAPGGGGGPRARGDRHGPARAGGGGIRGGGGGGGPRGEGEPVARAERDRRAGGDPREHDLLAVDRVPGAGERPA